MEKSKPKRNLSTYYNQIGRIAFEENVIHISKYLQLLKDELIQLQRDLKHSNLDSIQLFNEKFETYKIKFFYDNDLINKGVNGIVEGETVKDVIKIYVNDEFYFHTNKDNLDVFNEFSKQLLLLLGHELVHRGQYYVRKGDFINFYNFEGSLRNGVDIDYLKNHQEAMAYAWMYIESLRYSGFKNNDIMNMLKTGNFQKSRSLHIDFYISDMKKYNRDAFLQFRKYILQYIDDPIRYELKFNV
jgi:hypothetical protein